MTTRKFRISHTMAPIDSWLVYSPTGVLAYRALSLANAQYFVSVITGPHSTRR